MGREEGLLVEVDKVDGFVAYTRGELAAGTDPEAALRWFTTARRRCAAVR